ncbi:MAG: hypothetical protein K8T90_22620, partial [Planctomycetes bacterium]|nr:hypothetical protein [Planctomycetota bacterium]
MESRHATASLRRSLATPGAGGRRGADATRGATREAPRGRSPRTHKRGAGGDTSEAIAYDALNRLLQAKDDDSIVNLTYDSLSRVLTEVQGSNPLGTPLRAKHASRESAVRRADRARRRTAARRAGGPRKSGSGKTVTYSWNDESARTKIDYPSGFDANEARDSLGRVTAITDGSSATVASFDLYGAGLREKKRTLANSTYTAVTYDGFRRPTDIDHKTSG